MSKTVDERIVSMQFDNQEFERRIATTQNSLKSLDNSLKFDNSKGISSLQSSLNSLDLSGISSSIEFLQERFSAFGIAGMKIIEELTETALNFGKKIFNSTIGQIITGGEKRATNIENARFMLQGLIKDETELTDNENTFIDSLFGSDKDWADIDDKNKKVQAVMQLAQDSVTDTAYGYDEAAKAAAQFYATGVELEDLAAPLKAITGIAATTNSSYEGIAHIFNTIAGNNRVMGMQLTQLSSYGLNAAASITEYFNGIRTGEIAASDEMKEYVEALTTSNKRVSDSLEFTEGDIRNFVSNGMVSFKMFTNAMNETFGDHAKEANKTVSGALSNVNAALSRTGAMFKSALIEQEGPMVQMYNALRIAINNVNKELGPFANVYIDVMSKIYKGIASIADLETGEMILDISSLMKGLQNILSGFLGVMSSVGDGLKGLFPDNLLDRINDSIHEFEKFTEKFTYFSDILNKQKDLSGELKKLLSPDELKDVNEQLTKLSSAQKILWNIRDIFMGVRDAILIAKDAVFGLIDGIKISFSGVGQIGRSLLDFGANLGQFITNIKQATQETEFFHRIAEAVGSIFNAILKPAFDAISKVIDYFSGKLYDLSKDEVGAINFFEKLASAVEKFASFIVDKGITPAIDGIGTALGWLGEKLAPLKGYFEDTKTAITNFLSGFKKKDTENVSLLSAILDALGISLTKVWEVLKKVVGKISELVSNALGGLNAENVVDAGIFSLLVAGIIKIANALRDLKNQGSWIFADFQKIPKTINELADSVRELMKTLKKSAKIKDLKNIAISLLMLAGAMVLIASIDSDKLWSSFGVMSAMIAELLGIVVAMKKLDAFGGGKISAVSKNLIAMSAAVLILALALKSVSKIESDELWDSIAAVEILLVSLTLVSKVLSSENEQKMMKGSTALIAMALSVRILASSVKTLANLSWEGLARGLVGVVALLGSIAGFAYLTKNLNLSGFGFQLILLSTGLLILTKVVKTFGEMDFGQLGQGLLGITTALVGIGLALELFPEKGMVTTGLGLILVAAGLKILTKVLKSLATMSIGDLVKSIVSMTAALTALAFIMNVADSAVAGAAAMLIMSVALIAFGAALKNVASIGLLDLIKAIGALTLGLAALGAVAMPLTLAMIPMLAMAGALLLLATAVSILAAGLSVLSIMGSGAVTIITMFATALMGLIPQAMAAIAYGFVQVLVIIANSGAEILGALTTLLVAILDTLIAVIPKFVEFVVALIVAILDAAIELIPKVIELGTAIIVTLLDAIIALVPKMIETGVTIVVSIIEGLAAKLGAIIQAGWDLIIAFLNGIADGIEGNWDSLIEAGNRIIIALWEGIKRTFGDLWEKIKGVGHDFIQWVKDGLDEKLTDIKEWFLAIPGKVKEWFQEKIEDIKTAGSNLIEGLKNGLTSGEGGLLGTVSGIGSRLLGSLKGALGINSPSKETAEIGKFLDQGLIKGLDKYSFAVDKAAEGVGDDALEAMRQAVKGIATSDLSELTDPIIRPVLDLSEIQNGGNRIEDLLSGTYGVGLSTLLSGPNQKGANPSQTNTTINMTVNGADGQSVNDLANVVMRKINQSLKSQERVWA